MGIAIKQEKHLISRFAVLIVALALLLVAVTLMVLYFGMGYRVVNYRYASEDGSQDSSARALVRVDKDGEMFTGTVYASDGSQYSFSRVSIGYYKVEYDNGDVYEGGLDRLLREGEGKLTLANGDVYSGSFAYDMPWGEGTYLYYNGDVYIGGFVAGQKSGEGVYTFAAVEGEVTRKYEGAFQNDLRNGYGIYYYADGSVYHGNFVNDIRCDNEATLVIANGDGTEDIYVGGFENDIKSGKGEYRWASGAVYVGDFKNDIMEGQGTYTWPDGSHSYTGTFKGNKPYIEK